MSASKLIVGAVVAMAALVNAQDMRMGNVNVQTLFTVNSICTDMTFIDNTKMLISSKDGRIFYGRSNDNGLTWYRARDVGNIGGRIAQNGDRGLMSIAYNPNGWVYISYVRNSGSSIKNNQISRIRWTGDGLDWNSEQILFGKGCRVRKSAKVSDLVRIMELGISVTIARPCQETRTRLVPFGSMVDNCTFPSVMVRWKKVNSGTELVSK
jgi:hypothetical protein